jgi:hypothetical protein
MAPPLPGKSLTLHPPTEGSMNGEVAPASIFDFFLAAEAVKELAQKE